MHASQRPQLSLPAKETASRTCSRIFQALSASIWVAFTIGCGGGAPASQVPTPNPQPAIKSISPSMTLEGSGPQIVMITGSNFVASSTVTFAGMSEASTFVNSGQLTIQLTPAQQATAGAYPVIVTNPAPGGGQSGSVNFTVNNPQPTLASISPSVLAAASLDTTIALTGTGFGAGSTVILNGAPVKTEVISATELDVVIPSAQLNNPGVLTLTAANSTPGGGNSASVSLNVVTVSSFAILAVPSAAESPANSWLISAAAVDGQGLPIVGLPVTFSTSAGNLSAVHGTTTATGALTVQLTSPSGTVSPQSASVSASTGTQTAVAAITLGGSATPSVRVSRRAQLTSVAEDTSSVNAMNFLASVGVSGPPGSINPFPGVGNCVTADALSTVPTSQCASTLSQNSIQVNASTFVNVACSTLTAFNNLQGVVQCAGFSVSVISCALSETGLGAVICGAALTTGFEVTLGLASGCLQYLAGLAADQFHLNLLTTAIDEFGIFTDATNPLGYATLICDTLPPRAPTSTAGASTQLVCPPASTCLVVVNFGSDSITIYDADGKQLGTPIGAFSGLSGPDGIIFDPNNNYFYIANINSNSISVYDLYGNPVTTKFVGLTISGIEDVSFDSLRHHLIANSPSQNQISAFEEDGTPVDLTGGFAMLNQPYGVGVNPHNGVLYVSNSNNSATLYDSTGKQIVLSSGAFSGLTFPDDVTFDPATGNIFIAESADNSGAPCAFSGIAVFDQNGNTVATPGGFPNLSCPDQIITNGNAVSLRLYVTNITGNSIRIYDDAGNDLTAPNVFPGLNQPTGIAILQTPSSW